MPCLGILSGGSPLICHRGKKEGRNFRVSPEAVGAAKVMKLVVRLHQFSMKLRDEGRTEYELSEQLEYIRDILDA